MARSQEEQFAVGYGQRLEVFEEAEEKERRSRGACRPAPHDFCQSERRPPECGAEPFRSGRDGHVDSG